MVITGHVIGSRPASPVEGAADAAPEMVESTKRVVVPLREPTAVLRGVTFESEFAAIAANIHRKELGIGSTAMTWASRSAIATCIEYHPMLAPISTNVPPDGTSLRSMEKSFRSYAPKFRATTGGSPRSTGSQGNLA